MSRVAGRGAAHKLARKTRIYGIATYGFPGTCRKPPLNRNLSLGLPTAESIPICVQPITRFFSERVVGSDRLFQKASKRVPARAGTGFFGQTAEPNAHAVLSNGNPEAIVWVNSAVVENLGRIYAGLV